MSLLRNDGIISVNWINNVIDIRFTFEWIRDRVNEIEIDCIIKRNENIFNIYRTIKANKINNGTKVCLIEEKKAINMTKVVLEINDKIETEILTSFR